MTVRYTASYSGLGELMRGEEMQAVVREVAEKGMAFAQSVSPVRTGEYLDSFEVTVTGDGGPGNDRAEAQIINTSDHAVEVEWRDGHKVLTRTLGVLSSL